MFSTRPSRQLQNTQRFLVVEDDDDIALLLKLHLSSEHIDVTVASDGLKGL